MTPDLQQRIQNIVSSDRVVLFMKGTRDQPQCGFSAQVVQILDRVVADYQTFDVLADQEVREGIKQFSDWPTIPQLYVGGEFQGGCDIVREMYEAGELHQALGVERAAAGDVDVDIMVTDGAVELLEEAQARYGGEPLHLSIDARFRHSLGFGPADPSEVEVEANGITIHLDADSAARARGLVIDVEETPGGKRLHIDNPQAPSVAGRMNVQEYQQLREEGTEHRLVDVRTPAEREIAAIDGSVLFDDALAQELVTLPKDTLMVFYCHSGGRSQVAADQFGRLGFTRVFNLEGGIDAWSIHVDSSVPRY